MLSFSFGINKCCCCCCCRCRCCLLSGLCCFSLTRYLQKCVTWGVGGGEGTPLFGLYGDVPLDRVWFFGLAVLNRVYNSTCLCPKQVRTCPKQGMVLRAERLKLRLRVVSFFSLPATRSLGEVERACDRAAENRRIFFLICVISTE